MKENKTVYSSLQSKKKYNDIEDLKNDLVELNKQGVDIVQSDVVNALDRFEMSDDEIDQFYDWLSGVNIDLIDESEDEEELENDDYLSSEDSSEEEEEDSEKNIVINYEQASAYTKVNDPVKPWLKNLRKKMDLDLPWFNVEQRVSEKQKGFPFFKEPVYNGDMDIDSYISKLDEEIARLEAEEKAERKKRETEKKYHVVIVEVPSNRTEIAKIIVEATEESLEKAIKRTTQFPIDIAFGNKNKATKFAKDITNAGGKAKVITL